MHGSSHRKNSLRTGTVRRSAKKDVHSGNRPGRMKRARTSDFFRKRKPHHFDVEFNERSAFGGVFVLKNEEKGLASRGIGCGNVPKPEGKGGAGTHVEARHVAVRGKSGRSGMADIENADRSRAVLGNLERQGRGRQNAQRDCQENHDGLPFHEDTIKAPPDAVKS
jgi:hypothetical protein